MSVSLGHLYIKVTHRALSPAFADILHEKALKLLRNFSSIVKKSAACVELIFPVKDSLQAAQLFVSFCSVFSFDFKIEGVVEGVGNEEFKLAVAAVRKNISVCPPFNPFVDLSFHYRQEYAEMHMPRWESEGELKNYLPYV
jgi:hypothetical protein